MAGSPSGWEGRGAIGIHRSSTCFIYILASPAYRGRSVVRAGPETKNLAVLKTLSAVAICRTEGTRSAGLSFCWATFSGT